MSLLDDLKKLLEKKKTATPQEQSQFIDQLQKEKELYETLKSMGLTLTPTEATERARLKPEGIMNLVEKVNLIDLITKITEVTTIKTLENLDLIDRITLIDNITNLGTLNLLNTVNLIKSISSIDNITTIGTVNQITKILEARLIQDKYAIEGNDIDAEGSAICPNGILTDIVILNVPNGYTLLIYDWSVALENSQQTVFGELFNQTADTVFGYGGGYRGFQTPFSKPKKVVGQAVIKIRAIQNSGAEQTIDAHMGGIWI